MSEKKVLTVNPDLFSFSNNTTRKKKEKDKSENKIKIKPPSKNLEKNTLKKRSLLRMIRQQQNEKYDEMLQQNGVLDQKVKTDLSSNLNSEYKKAEDYLKNLTNKVNTHNNTLKTYSKPNNIPTIYANNLKPVDNINVNNSETMVLNNKPQYGCMKNGKLPTYRTYMNQTRKNLQPISNSPINQISQISQSPQPPSVTHVSQINPVALVPQNDKSSMENILNNNNNNKIDNYLNNSISTKPAFNTDNINLKEQKTKCKKRKKILRRTYKVGKNKALNKISILVSNKSIRNNTTTKKQLYKQVSIDEIKSYLIKHGFIKIGTICPPNLMRKMYETSLLMCGEIQNHNSDNLLYNFLNNSDE